MPQTPSSQTIPRKLSQGEEPIQLYRPASACKDTEELLLREDDLTDEEILEFCSGKPLPPLPGEEKENNNSDPWRLQFHQRRAEIREWAEQLKQGRARIDEDGRLVPVTQPPQPPRANLPLAPQAVAAPPLNILEENNDAEEQWIEQERREAADAIARAVRRYRQQDIPEHDFEVVLIEPLGVGGAEPVNLTFRRICIAVLAVVTAFVCVILQTLPLLEPPETLDPNFDKLLHELLQVRGLNTHVQYCPGLHRDESDNWKDRLWQNTLGLLLDYSESNQNCNDGVLHIPAKHVLLGNYMHSSTKEEAVRLKPFAGGINVSWALPCHGVDDANISRCYPGAAAAEECAASSSPLCFRGVHDNILSDREVDDALRLGNYLILNGGDHFDVHYDVSSLERRIPSIVEKLRLLLRETYKVDSLHPVAFRVNTAGPMDGHGVNLYRSPALTLNQTMYLNWIEKSKRQNELAYYSLPWPFHVQPVRDTCNLIADLEADPRFAIHTSVFLADGAGTGYRGGVALYMDDHRSNSNPKHRIRRGVTIDGSRGRVVVSTGGIENRRCRLPTRAGLRTVLQIWWDC